MTCHQEGSLAASRGSGCFNEALASGTGEHGDQVQVHAVVGPQGAVEDRGAEVTR
ncbi:MAG TPA: hypothetical protein VIJ00_01975 [Nakamurella sp.]